MASSQQLLKKVSAFFGKLLIAFAFMGLAAPALAAAPDITGITPPDNGTYTVGQTLEFRATFTEIVTVTNTPSLTLTIGSTTRNAAYVTGSGSNNLTFHYTVALGDVDSDGIVVSSPVVLNSGTIKNAADEDSNLTFTPPTTTGVLVSAPITVPTMTEWAMILLATVLVMFGLTQVMRRRRMFAA